ncbi:MAG TPA: tail fiber domain-containing protein [Streptosporangiaceae bacterium]
MWADREDYGISVQYDERLAAGEGLHIRTHHFEPEGSTKLFISRGNGRVGIGTTAPGGNLHIDVPESAQPIHANLIDVRSFKTTANAKASSFLRLRDIGAGTATVFTVNGDGGVGIGTSNTQNQRLVVAGGAAWFQGDAFVSGRLVYWWGPDNRWKKFENRANDYAGSYNTDGPNTSDVRLKSDVQPLSGALDLVKKLRGVRYQWGEDGLSHFTRDIESEVCAGPDATQDQDRQVREEVLAEALAALAGDRIGLIAQDVEAVLPELVYANKEGYKHIRYQHLTALLAEAIKEQDAALRALSAEVAALRAGQ